MKENKNEINDIDPYKLDKLSKIPSWLIILTLKYWAAAAAVFFSVIGGVDLGFEYKDVTTEAQILRERFATLIFISLFLALFLNYIVRPIVRLLYNRRNNTYKYNMVNVKGFKSFLIQLAYAIFVYYIIYFITIFLGSKGLQFDPFGTTGGAGIEPFSQGIYFIVVDAVCIIIKNSIVKIYQIIKYKKQILGD